MKWGRMMESEAWPNQGGLPRGGDNQLKCKAAKWVRVELSRRRESRATSQVAGGVQCVAWGG